MNETKKTLKIFKHRWPEVTLLIALQFMIPFLTKIILSENKQPNILFAFFVSILSFLVAIASILLKTGFLRTVYLENERPQLLRTLLQEGKPFFWRIVGLGMIYVFILLLVFITIANLTNHPLQEQSSLLRNQLIITTVHLLLIKFFLLLPAVIIVLDCSISSSFKALKFYKLTDAGQLVALFFFQICLGYLWLLLPISRNVESTSYVIITMLSAVVGNFIYLMLGVMAVRFVASSNIVYDNTTQQQTENSEANDFEE